MDMACPRIRLVNCIIKNRGRRGREAPGTFQGWWLNLQNGQPAIDFYRYYDTMENLINGGFWITHEAV
jgi:hypothetical protein